MMVGCKKRTIHHLHGQSLVEFALILPLFVLLLVGIFDLGRAFFAYIAISNAAREGVRVYTFDPEDTTREDIFSAVDFEIGSSTVVDLNNIVSTVIHCYNSTNNWILVTSNLELAGCKSEAAIEVTIAYHHALILSFFYPDGLTLVRAAKMMVP